MPGDSQDRLQDRFAYGHYGSTYEKDVLTDYFDELEGKLRYKWWFCGHYHVNLQLDDRHIVLYEDIVRLADFQKYVYKRGYKDQVGYCLRQQYECGKIKNESEFREVLENVLFDRKEIR